ncbi:MAG TPA: glycosyltransferase [Solirubrobacteraceae bacterium]|nr:glycosyltransferase [Solirubrobacteraceae bacterium]
MSESLPTVSVVAPTYERLHGLPRFLDAILREPAAEVVMAVDGSRDGSVEWLRERARADERIVVLDRPHQGAGGARQAGLEAASGDVVLLLDDDVIASPGLVEGHARHHVALEPKLVLGYMPNDWRAVAPERRAIAWVYRYWYEVHCTRYAAEPDFVLSSLWGGNLSMPREAMLRIGFQSLSVRRGQDDRDFGLRCLKAGVRAQFDRSLHGVHLYDRAMADFRSDSRLQGECRRLLRAAHPDVLGDPRESAKLDDTVGMRLPAPLRRMLPLLARDPVFGPLTGTIELAHRTAVRQGHLGLEVFAARGLGSLDVMRGILDVSARLRSPNGGPPLEHVHRGVVAGDAADAAAAPRAGAA